MQTDESHTAATALISSTIRSLASPKQLTHVNLARLAGMKILHVTAWGAPPHSPGAPEYNLALEEARLGHDVTLFTFGLNLKSPRIMRKGSLTLIRFPYFVGDARMIGSYRALIPRFSAIPHYLSYLERWRGDIVHMHFATSLSVSSSLWLRIRRKKLPIIMTNLDPFFAAGLRVLYCSMGSAISSVFSGKTTKSAVSGYLSSIPFRLADRIVVLTEFERRTLASQGLPVAKMNIIPLGVNIERYSGKSPDFCSAHGIPHPMILNVGRFVEQKGQRYLIEAIPKVLPEVQAHYVFFGHQDDTLVELRQLARRLGVAEYVHFYKNAAVEELASAYHDCDIFAFPSLFESFGLALVEAMAIGKPVIAFSVCGIPEILEQGACGMLVQAGDVSGLAAALTTLLQSKEERVRLGEAARISVTNRYDSEAVARKNIELYENVREARISQY